MIIIKYVGSKNRIAKYIAPIIQSYIDGMGDKCNGYWEPFVGGANMIDKIKCEYKYGTDKHKYLIALLRHVQQSVDDLPNTITEDEYKAVNTNPNNYPDWYVGLVGFCTFGAKWFGGYPRGFKADGVTPRDITNEAIRNLKKQAPNLKVLSFIIVTTLANLLMAWSSTVTHPIEIQPSMRRAVLIMTNFILGAKKCLRPTLFL